MKHLSAPRVLIGAGLVLGLGDVLLIKNDKESVSSFLGKHMPELILSEALLSLHFMAWPQWAKGFDPFRRIARQVRGER